MNVRTLTGASIQEALTEARRLLGDDVVLLESVAASEGRLARVTVLADPAPPEPLPQQLAPPDFGALLSQTRGTPPPPPAPLAGRRAGQPRQALLSAPPPAPDAEPSTAVLELLLARLLRPLHDRLDAIERAAGGPVLASLMQWASHPLFRGLLDAGMRPERAGSLFGALVAQGFEPAAASAQAREDLRWALAATLRDQLGATPPARISGALVMIGASGAGRTSLLVKLAAHPSFYGRRRCSVLVADPEGLPAPAGLDLYDRCAPYERVGLQVVQVRTPEEVLRAVATTSTDQWLVDTPPLPRAPEAATRLLAALHHLLSPIVPLDVVLVLDAARAPHAERIERLRHAPLAPQAIALTRVDEAPGWGHLADVVLGLPLPIHVVSLGPAVPDDLIAYTPGWLAEAVAQRLAAP